MLNFPFYRYPYYYNRLPNYYNSNNINDEINSEFDNNENDSINSSENPDISKQISSRSKTSKGSNSSIFNFQDFLNFDTNEPIFEILGLKLYLDDIIILCLIFFLYQEGVKDDMLFLSLILLLLI